MLSFQTKSYAVVGIVTLITIFAFGNGWNEAEAATPGNNLSSGGACEVTEGPNKGKKGTYGEDGWCEGDWGGTECGETKCKDDEKKGPSLGRINTFDGGKIKTTITHQIYETKDKKLKRCSSTILTGNTSSVTAVCFPVEVFKLENLEKSNDKLSRSIADAINYAIENETLTEIDPMVFGTTGGSGEVFTVFLKIKCTKRGADGRCNQATCERERDPDSPTGYELQSCSLFSLGCDSNGHDTAGDGRNNSTCTRKAAQN